MELDDGALQVSPFARRKPASPQNRPLDLARVGSVLLAAARHDRTPPFCTYVFGQPMGDQVGGLLYQPAAPHRFVLRISLDVVRLGLLLVTAGLAAEALAPIRIAVRPNAFAAGTPRISPTWLQPVERPHHSTSSSLVRKSMAAQITFG